MGLPILIVEDDLTLGTIVAGYLESEGFVPEVALSGQEGLRRVATGTYGLVLLDLGLPDEDGLAILRRLRSRTQVPVMVVSARNTLDTRLTAFELGASDILPKPFDPRELRYRVLNLVGRQQRESMPGSFRLGDWTLDARTHTVSDANGRDAGLTSQEFAVLRLLASGGGKVYSRGQIIDAASSGSDPESDRAIDILVSRIRRKLSVFRDHSRKIVTVRGIGYRVEPASPAPPG